MSLLLVGWGRAVARRRLSTMTGPAATRSGLARWTPCRLQVGHAFGGLVVAATLDVDLGRGGFDLRELVGREFDVGGADVFFQSVQLARAGDRDDPGLLVQQPREGDLAGGGAPCVGRCS